MANNTHKHLAVLIDADNAPAAIVEGLFEEIGRRLPVGHPPLVFSRLKAERNKYIIKYSCISEIK